ncbi:hypothetical protein GCK32_021565, partial [Trichostrongylus colubriformis]
PVHRHRLRPSSLSCPHDLLDIDPMDNEGVCAYKCGADVMFSSEEKVAARTWMIMWGGFDFLVSLFTFLTFLIERNRFRFPERYVFLCPIWDTRSHFTRFYIVCDIIGVDLVPLSFYGH